jgi:poly(A) polymerase
MAKTRLSLGPELRDLLTGLTALFEGRGVEAYVVGGFLRDVLLGRGAHDVDVAVAGEPMALGAALAEEVGGSVFALGEERGAARVMLPSLGLHVDLTPLRGDIEADLRERDFTIDAMAAPLAEAAAGRAEIVDPLGGRDDLGKRLVRVVSEEAFRADPLRPLRGARLAVELGFTLEAATAGLVSQYAGRIAEAAAERRRDELMRVLSTPRAGAGLQMLDDLDLLEALLPELSVTRGVEQPKEHHWDVFGHVLAAVSNLDALLSEERPSEEPSSSLWGELWKALDWWEDGRAFFRAELPGGHSRAAVLKLCALLHDIAKPETKSFQEDGRMRFFGHAEAGADMAAAVLKRLRFSSQEVAIVSKMVRAHLRPVQMAQQGAPTGRALYRYFRDCGDDAGILTLFLSLADHLATVGPNVDADGWRQHVALVNYILAKRFQEEGIVAPPALLGGEELMRELDLSPGPLVGRLLEVLTEAQAAGEVSTREQALALARSTLAEQGAAGEPARSDGA